MIDHPIAFVHDLFLDCVQKVRNSEVQYKAITFYISQHPMQLTRLLQVLTPNLDHSRVVHLLRKHDSLFLALDYLKAVQKENLSVVNEALNEIFVSEEDYQSLRSSIDDFDNFDQIHLAQKIERHELLEFRRLSAYLYKRNKRYAQSITLSKGDRMYKDAIDTCAESKDADLTEELIRFFVNVNDKACFAATLYTCYDLIRPDIVLELAWRNGYNDFAMPYMIQYMRHLHDKVKTLEERTAPPPEPEAASVPVESMMGMMGGDTLMITNGAPYMPQGNYGGIPDPYQQQPAYGGGFGQPTNFGAGIGGFGAPAGMGGGMGMGGFNNNGFQPQQGSGW